ncbi:hypothetical protein SLS64_010131 [Diaporthe eres]
MKRRPRLPAVVLGLNLAQPLEFTSWLRTLTNTTSITTKKRPYVVTTPSPSTVPLEPPQISLWKSLDTCLQEHGAMEPFHTFFDQSLLDVGAVEPRAMDITNDDNDQSDLDHTKITADTDRNTDKIELIDEYQHYCQLIELGNPQNRRDRNFVPQKPVEDGHNDMATPGPATQAAGDLAIAVTFEACGDTASEDPKAPPMQSASDPQEELMQPEGMQLEAQSDLDSENNSTAPSTPAEAAAWAHSYCDADPESAKLKILTDDRGREYVLYHDCFHCVPIELAPEFIGMTHQEEDDGYGSATETSEAAKDGAKLGTIPEEEDEG